MSASHLLAFLETFYVSKQNWNIADVSKVQWFVNEGFPEGCDNLHFS